jgi:hypothetical protein
VSKTPDDLVWDGLSMLDRYGVKPPESKDLRSVREALAPLIFDGNVCRDDVAELCQQIDDVVK